jgi:hypothetical protein
MFRCVSPWLLQTIQHAVIDSVTLPNAQESSPTAFVSPAGKAIGKGFCVQFKMFGV